jgi:hypothetical protein
MPTILAESQAGCKQIVTFSRNLSHVDGELLFRP